MLSGCQQAVNKLSREKVSFAQTYFLELTDQNMDCKGEGRVWDNRERRSDKFTILASAFSELNFELRAAVRQSRDPWLSRAALRSANGVAKIRGGTDSMCSAMCPIGYQLPYYDLALIRTKHTRMIVLQRVNTPWLSECCQAVNKLSTSCQEKRYFLPKHIFSG